MPINHLNKDEYDCLALPPLEPFEARIKVSKAALGEISSQTGLSNLTFNKSIQNPIAPILIFSSATSDENVAIVRSDEMDEIRGFCIVDDQGEFVR